MNIHPIFVHFPIALLLLWSGIEIFRRHRWLKKFDWKPTQIVLLIGGFIGAFIALQTGEIAEELAGRSDMIEMHSLFANITTYTYLLFVIELLLPPLFRVISRGSTANWATKINTVIGWYVKILQWYWLRALIIIFAGVCLTVTGMLGGIMVYGADVDPLAKYLLQILGLSA